MNILPNYWVKITWSWKVNLLLKSFFLLNNFLNFFDHVIWSLIVAARWEDFELKTDSCITSSLSPKNIYPTIMNGK